MRIIPARAGFTQSTDKVDRNFKDHPRSRGVYSKTSTIRLTSSGSSPLARGLPRRRHVSAVQPRIIPARAGFTSQDERVSMMNADHPRSRGVYLSPPRLRRLGPGSSPLARGLPAVRARGRRVRRIIPARAGFTVPGARCSPPAEDHPRSRGVYAGMYMTAEMRTGIIPARAGFTPGCWR